MGSPCPPPSPRPPPPMVTTPSPPPPPLFTPPAAVRTCTLDCFGLAAHNAQTGIGYLYADSMCSGSGGLGCYESSGCRHCAFSQDTRIHEADGPPWMTPIANDGSVPAWQCPPCVF